MPAVKSRSHVDHAKAALRPARRAGNCGSGRSPAATAAVRKHRLFRPVRTCSQDYAYGRRLPHGACCHHRRKMTRAGPLTKEIAMLYKGLPARIPFTAHNIEQARDRRALICPRGPQPGAEGGVGWVNFSSSMPTAARCAAADDGRHRGRRCGGQRLRPGDGPRRSPLPVFASCPCRSLMPDFRCEEFEAVTPARLPGDPSRRDRPSSTLTLRARPQCSSRRRFRHRISLLPRTLVASLRHRARRP